MLDVLKRIRFNFFNQYVKPYLVKTNQPSVLMDHHFQVYGNAMILLMIKLKLAHEMLDDQFFQDLFERYASFILKILGFYESEPDTMTEYNINQIWISFSKYATLILNSEAITSKSSFRDMLKEKRWGLGLYNDLHSILIIQQISQQAVTFARSPVKAHSLPLVTSFPSTHPSFIRSI